MNSVMLGRAAEPNRTDAELDAKVIDGGLIETIGLALWSRIRQAGLEQAILVAAELGGPAAVNAITIQCRADHLFRDGCLAETRRGTRPE
jgi:hypothetical protein